MKASIASSRASELWPHVTLFLLPGKFARPNYYCVGKQPRQEARASTAYSSTVLRWRRGVNDFVLTE
ncbi:hypothetical protein ACFODL_13905 [Phenylobacterium terrae]|uniref:Uncharacterized protein n=1 Tax=Phenylobacterium terrae TaxID=2665495 RepID=A0ABW4N1P2_9CAUL